MSCRKLATKHGSAVHYGTPQFLLKSTVRLYGRDVAGTILVHSARSARVLSAQNVRKTRFCQRPHSQGFVFNAPHKTNYQKYVAKNILHEFDGLLVKYQ